MSYATLPGKLTIGSLLALDSGNTTLNSSATDTLNLRPQAGFVAGTYNGVTYNSQGVATGVVAGTPSNLTGYTTVNNTALGIGTTASTVGTNNCLMGYFTTIGAAATQNVVIGAQAASGTGQLNVVIGRTALNNGAGAYNVVIGAQATGGTNGAAIAIGAQANADNGAVAIGYANCSGTTNAGGTFVGGYQLQGLGAISLTHNTCFGAAITASAAANYNTIVGENTTMRADRCISIGDSNIINNAAHSNALLLGHAITSSAANLIHLGSSTYPFTVSTTVGGAGGASALPATPLGYLSVNINGLGAKKIPYYN